MILAGAWVLDRRAGLPAIETLLRTELANFLRQDQTPARNIALLQEGGCSEFRVTGLV